MKITKPKKLPLCWTDANRNWPSLFNSMAAGLFGLLEADEALYERHLYIRQRQVNAGEPPRHVSVSRHSPGRCGTSFRSAGCAPMTPISGKIPNRVYYLSMEFLIGRSLANNVTNLMLDPFVSQIRLKEKNLDWLSPCLNRNPTPAWAMAVYGVWRKRAFSIPWQPCKSPPWATDWATNTASFARPFKTAGRTSNPTIGCAAPTFRSCAPPRKPSKVNLGCSFRMRGGTLEPILGKPSRADRDPVPLPVVGFGGKTINTLRLWAAATPDFFDFKEFSQGRLCRRR